MSTSLCNPLEEAKKYYGSSFGFMVDEFLSEQRYLYSGDDFFVMAYPHILDLLFEQNTNKVLDKYDVWVIHFFSGNIKRLFEIAPFKLPYVAFEKKEKWKVYETDKLKRKCYGIT